MTDDELAAEKTVAVLILEKLAQGEFGFPSAFLTSSDQIMRAVHTLGEPTATQVYNAERLRIATLLGIN